MVKKKIELTRVNMNLPTSLVKKVIEYGENLGLNTTSAYIVLLNQALDSKTTLDNLPSIMELMNEVKKAQENMKE